MFIRILSGFLVFFLIIPAAAIDEFFYLTRKNNVEKLIPSTLRCSLGVGDEDRIFVDPYPHDANIGEITWECSSDIVEISPDGRTCSLRSLTPGVCSLTATEESGATCEIRICVSSNISESLRLIGPSDSISVGDIVFIHAQPSSTDAEIMWQVQEDGCARVSYGGRICKINARRAGSVYVRAHILNSNTSADYILEIHPKNTFPTLFASMPNALFISALALLLLAFTLWLRRRKI